MNKMKFPIIEKTDKHSHYPTEDICPICGTDRTKLDNKFFGLNGGALKKTGRDRFVPSEDLAGFLSLFYHSGESGENDQYLDIVELSRNGQFEFYFCSIECLQEFFNQIIEKIKTKCGFELEKKK